MYHIISNRLYSCDFKIFTVCYFIANLLLVYYLNIVLCVGHRLPLPSA